MNIVSMGEKNNNGMMLSPGVILREAIKDIGENGALKNGKKVLVIALDDTDGQYELSWYQSGMKMSQCVALCEISKARFLEEMGY